MGFYFNRIYNPVYDFIVSQIAPYHRLQETCIQKLELSDGDRLLCAGVGTGNEILHVIESNPNVRITGIDYSSTAIKKAQKKARKRGVEIETRLMDVHNLDFADGSFDKALCVHVTDFVKDSGRASSELVRVLRKNGRFAVTFPSGKEDVSFGVSVIGDAIHHQVKNKRFHQVPVILASALVGTIVYLPFLFRRARRQYTRQELEKMFSSVTPGKFQIEEFPVYNDYIVHGTK
ncbi:MAG: class I SAM-dependent methyltransferase [Dehalococcoidia bacterium]|nr:class I SAM-dependent methyltransferase [Dehalococcoidia bacterium]